MGYFSRPTPKKLAPIFVDLDEDLLLTYKVGPMGKAVETNVCSLIRLAASRG